MTPYWRISCRNRLGCNPRDSAMREPPTTAPPRLTSRPDWWCNGVRQYTVSALPRLAAEAVPNADSAQR